MTEMTQQEVTNTDFHPDWCSPAACTAYGPSVDEYHRSAPLVFKTEDRCRDLYVYKTSAQDGSHEAVEMAVLELPDGERGRPWHLCDPVENREILIPRDSADAMWRAMAEFV